MMGDFNARKGKSGDQIEHYIDHHVGEEDKPLVCHNLRNRNSGDIIPD